MQNLMKFLLRNIWLILAGLWLLSCIIPAQAASLPDYSDDTAYSNYAGRLYIPEVGIDVALYRSNKQYVVDRDDSAAYFEYRHEGHMTVADHWTQGFATLKDVTEGMEAYIVHPDGTTTYYTCTAVFDGHNTGHGITDWDGRIVHGDAPLLMYTCIDGWQDVRVCLWDVVAVTWEEREKPEDHSSGRMGVNHWNSSM